jgi:hypothetical protein
MRAIRVLSVLLVLPLAARSQTASVPTTAVQLSSAVLPLPAEFRGDATVLGYKEGTVGLTTLREGKGAFTCLASDPAGKQFHVACYHKSMEPFMARGRALRASGVKGDLVDSARFKEVRSGKLKMNNTPAALYTLTGGTFDAMSGTVQGARPLFVVYMPGSTPATTGLSATPAEGTPWIMYPGTPKAHIMFIPKM